MDLSKLFYVFLALCQTKANWPKFQSLLKLLLWKKGVEWFKVLNACLGYLGSIWPFFSITCPATGGVCSVGGWKCNWHHLVLFFIWCLIKLVAACPATSVFYVWAECRRIWQKLITPTNPFDGRDHTLSDRGVFHQIGVVMLASPCKKANNQIEKNKISEGKNKKCSRLRWWQSVWVAGDDTATWWHFLLLLRRIMMIMKLMTH